VHPPGHPENDEPAPRPIVQSSIKAIINLIFTKLTTYKGGKCKLRGTGNAM
jgi:hypothetical protein